jgi:N-hydroxyarylamine O-acetyltransferase
LKILISSWDGALIWIPGLFSISWFLKTEGDIAYGNHYTSTSPDTFFTFSRVAARPVAGGEITLLDRTLTITDNGRKQVHTLPDSPAYLDAVKMHFGIELDASYSDLKPLPPGLQDTPPQPLYLP